MADPKKIEAVPAFLEPVKLAINQHAELIAALQKLSGDGRTITIDNNVIRFIGQTGSGLGGYSDDAPITGQFLVIPMDDDSDDYRVVYIALSSISGAAVESTTLAGFISMRMATEQYYPVPKAIITAVNTYIYVLTHFTATGVESVEICAGTPPANTRTQRYTYIARIENRKVIQIQNGAISFAWRIGAY